MSTSLTARQMAGVSPRSRARTTVVVYLLFFVTAIVGELFTERAGVSGLTALPGDATTVAHGILAHEAAYRAGWAVTLISTVLYVAVVAFLFLLVRPVSRNLAVVAAFFGLVAQAVTAFRSLFPPAPLVILGGSPGAFDAKQLQALALAEPALEDGYVALMQGYRDGGTARVSYPPVRMELSTRSTLWLSMMAARCASLRSTRTYVA